MEVSAGGMLGAAWATSAERVRKSVVVYILLSAPSLSLM